MWFSEIIAFCPLLGCLLQIGLGSLWAEPRCAEPHWVEITWPKSQQQKCFLLFPCLKYANWLTPSLSPSFQNESHVCSSHIFLLCLNLWWTVAYSKNKQKQTNRSWYVFFRKIHSWLLWARCYPDFPVTFSASWSSPTKCPGFGSLLS